MLATRDINLQMLASIEALQSARLSENAPEAAMAVDMEQIALLNGTDFLDMWLPVFSPVHTLDSTGY